MTQLNEQFGKDNKMLVTVSRGARTLTDTRLV